MPRKVVPLITDEIYHVYNRGTDKRTVFEDKSDYIRFYLSLLNFNTTEPTIAFERVTEKKLQNENRLVDVQAYCLLPNHFHLILKQLQDGGVSEFMKRVSTGYTGYFNEKYERSGVLFQGTYKRVHVEDQEQYNYLFAYVNENYTVHGREIPDDVCFSSSRVHQGLLKSKLIHKPELDYDAKEAKRLANQIHEMRKRLTLEM